MNNLSLIACSINSSILEIHFLFRIFLSEMRIFRAETFHFFRMLPLRFSISFVRLLISFLESRNLQSIINPPKEIETCCSKRGDKQ